MTPYLRAANVTWHGIVLDDVLSMDFVPAERERYELKAGDILLNEASGSAGEVGKPAVWQGQLEGVCFQNTLIRVRAPAALVRFLYWHFLWNARSGAFAAASRGVGIHHLSAGVLADWLTRLPPLPEQHRIVAALDSYFSRLDAAEAALQRVEANLKRYRASVLKAAVEGRLVPTEAELARKEGRDYEPASVLLDRILVERRRKWEEAELAKMVAKGKPPANDKWKAKYKEPTPPDTEGLPELPEGWCWASVDQVMASTLIGLVRSKVQQSEAAPGARYVKMNQISVSGALDLDASVYVQATPEELANFQLRAGDLLFNTRNSAELVGKSALVQQDAPGTVFNNNLMRLRTVPVVYAPYIALQLLSRRFLDQIDRVKKATTSVAAVYAKDLLPRALAVPPAAEQVRIANRVSELLSVADATRSLLEGRMGHIGRLRQSILKWAFEGRLVDQDPSDEPASVLLERIRAEREAAAAKPMANRTTRKRKAKS